jgi:Ca2+-binding RTX toxin-like protein
MDAAVTLGPCAVSSGPTLFSGLLTTFYYADSVTLTQYDDVLMRDGGNDVAHLGAGNDIMTFGNIYGFQSDHVGHAMVDGGAGSDTIAFYFAGNDLDQSGIVVPTANGVKFDLQASIVVVIGSGATRRLCQLRKCRWLGAG